MTNRKWSPDVAALGDRIAGLTVAGAVELAAYLEAVHGIRAPSAPAVVRPPEPDAVVDEAKAEPTAFDVVLDGYEATRRVAVIRAVREATGLGLKEARDAVDACPRAVREGLSRPEAGRLRALLEAAGAQASVRPCAA